ASDVARTLGIRYGSAHFHLRVLVRAGIAEEVERRRIRGGTEILYAIPRGFSVPWDPASPPELWGAIARTHAVDLARRLDRAAADRRPSDAETDRMVMSDLVLTPEEARAALAAIDRMLARIRRLREHEAEPRPGTERFTLALTFFRAASEEP
ncbi:MAG: winged helix-turn-helix domain-containing protein, partial [Candidatus Velamenicoccus archaeovorus]